MERRASDNLSESVLTPAQVNRMLELAESEDTLRNYLLLLTMALTGLSRGEIVGVERPRLRWKLSKYLKTRTQAKGRLREEVLQQLMEGRVSEVEQGRRLIRLTPDKKAVQEIALDPSLSGLRIENLKGDSILVTEKFGKPRTVKLEPVLSQKLAKYIGDKKEGRIFPIGGDTVYKIIRKHGKAAGIPFPLKPRMLEDFHEKYQFVGIADLLRLNPFTAEFVEARTKEENEEVEWKLRISEPIEFCETMVAFANRAGGVILIGVDVDGSIHGSPHVNLAEIEDKLTNFNNEYCDPRVFFKVAEVKVQDKTVVVVEVKEGVDKPYWLKDRGFVIRSGSSDRIMKRSQVVSEILRAYGLARLSTMGK